MLVMATASCACDFKPVRMARRPLGDHDVLIRLVACGICHSDLHIARGHLEGVTGKVQYPLVPGHELAGVCAGVGVQVTKFAVGDHVGVGCMVDACLKCKECVGGEEQKCSAKHGNVATYNGRDRYGRAASWPVGGPTVGGYSSAHVVHERFAVKIPAEYPLASAGPVMCAGVTLFDPLRRYGATVGTKVAIVGVGGLGTMGIKIAKAMGAEVTAISRGASKEAYCRAAGADHFIDSKDAVAMAAAHGTLNLVMNTISANHDYHAYTQLLVAGPAGKHVILGLNNALGAAVLVDKLTFGRSRVKMSGIGGIEATQAVIDLCAKHNIHPEIKMVAVSEINAVYEALENGNDAGLRHVIDIEGSLTEAAFAACQAPPPKFNPSNDNGGMTTAGLLSEAAGMFFRGKW
jgi:uncharacterized zinc-type alcohol dehydrogenase-like protein